MYTGITLPPVYLLTNADILSFTSGSLLYFNSGAQTLDNWNGDNIMLPSEVLYLLNLLFTKHSCSIHKGNKPDWNAQMKVINNIQYSPTEMSRMVMTWKNY